MNAVRARHPDHDEHLVIEEAPDPESEPVERLAYEVTIPGCPISEPLTWPQICARYPDEWVCLVEIEFCNGISPAFHHARVVGHGKRPRDPYAQADPWQKHYRIMAHYYTGVVRGSAPRVRIEP